MRTRIVDVWMLTTSLSIAVLALASAPAALAAPGLTTRPANPDCVAPDPPQAGLQWQLLAYGVDALHMDQDVQNRWFTIGRTGFVNVYDGDAGYAHVGTALDITDRVTLTYFGAGGEFGALSIALDAGFQIDTPPISTGAVDRLPPMAVKLNGETA